MERRSCIPKEEMEKIKGGKEKREREIGLGEENGKLFLIRAFLQELDEHQVRKAALLLISTKAGEVTCCLARLVSAVQVEVSCYGGRRSRLFFWGQQA